VWSKAVVLSVGHMPPRGLTKFLRSHRMMLKN